MKKWAKWGIVVFVAVMILIGVGSYLAGEFTPIEDHTLCLDAVSDIMFDENHGSCLDESGSIEVRIIRGSSPYFDLKSLRFYMTGGGEEILGEEIIESSIDPYGVQLHTIYPKEFSNDIVKIFVAPEVKLDEGRGVMCIYSSVINISRC